jgi:hypothetical protein
MFYRKNGDIAGFTHKQSGYYRIRINGKQYQAHRIAWLYINGNFPDKIDHINHIKNDNRISNLRNASYVDNNRNATQRVDNTSGVTGVCWHKKNSRWIVKIGGQYIGSFNCINDAIATRKQKEQEINYHENHGTKGK